MILYDILGQLIAEGKITEDDGYRIKQAALTPAIPEYAVSRLCVSPGDIVVLKYNRGSLSRHVADDLRERFRERVGDVRLLILGTELDLSVLSLSEIEAHEKNQRQVPERIIDCPIS